MNLIDPHSSHHRQHHHHHQRHCNRRLLSQNNDKQQLIIIAAIVLTRIVKTSTVDLFYGKVTFHFYTSIALPIQQTKGWTKITQFPRELLIEPEWNCSMNLKQSKVGRVEISIYTSENNFFYEKHWQKLRLSSWRGARNTRIFTASPLRHSYSLSKL